MLFNYVEPNVEFLRFLSIYSYRYVDYHTYIVFDVDDKDLNNLVANIKEYFKDEKIIIKFALSDTNNFFRLEFKYN